MSLLLLLLGCRAQMAPEPAPIGDNKEVLRAWDDLLQRAVTLDGYVDYDLITEERAALDDFVRYLQRPDRNKQGSARLPFWINAYNALTIYQVIERGKPASVLDVQGMIPEPGAGFFYETEFLVNGMWMNLHDIEHEQVRMRAYDIRVHAALNCASRSCPPLRRGLYRRKGMTQALDDQMAIWVQDPERGVRQTEDGLAFSPIFDWYERDFSFWTGGDNLCNIQAQFATKKMAKKLHKLADQGCPKRFWTYDWGLNEAR